VSGPGFRKDLYQGTAEHYDHFRPGYPPALVDDLRSRAELGSSARVLDLACGTGQVAFALAGHAREVVAVDQEAGAVAYGQRKARRLGGSPWDGEQAWQRVFHETLERWRDVTGARDRVPEGWEDPIRRDPHREVLRRAGLDYEGKVELSVHHRWTVESLTGLVYSTSFLNRAVLGPNAGAFEDDLRRRLLACVPDGVFEQDLTFAYELARASW